MVLAFVARGHLFESCPDLIFLPCIYSFVFLLRTLFVGPEKMTSSEARMNPIPVTIINPWKKICPTVQQHPRLRFCALPTVQSGSEHKSKRRNSSLCNIFHSTAGVLYGSLPNVVGFSTIYHTIPTFNALEKKASETHWKKEKCW